MPAWSLTINLGSNDEGQKRREAYDKAAKKEATTLNDWAKQVLDQAAKIRFIKD